MPAAPGWATPSCASPSSAPARGARRIELDCFEDNAPALALYERNGFDTRSKGAARSLLLGRPL